MSLSHGVSIARANLVLYLDAANKKSYPGSGNVWYDLSGNRNNGTLRSNTVYSSNTTSFSLDGVSNYIDLPGALTDTILGWTPNGTIGTSKITIELWFKTTDTSGGLYSKPWNGAGGYNISATPSGWTIASVNYNYANTTSQTYSATVNDGIVHQLVLWIDSTNMGNYIDGGKSSSYKAHGITVDVNTDGVKNNTAGVIGGTFPYGVWAGNKSLSVQGDFYIFKVYNKVLSATEVAQNFEAIRGRYGV